jgi:hypothetical protein
MSHYTRRSLAASVVALAGMSAVGVSGEEDAPERFSACHTRPFQSS